MMSNSYMYGWSWVFWVFWVVLMFSMMGNWGYTYQAHRRFRNFSFDKGAIDLLSERYAKGEIQRDQFHQMKEEILLAQKSSRTNEETGLRGRGVPVM